MPQWEWNLIAFIPLPILYNPDESGKREKVEEEKFLMVADEIVKEFGACTFYRDRSEKDSVLGFWVDQATGFTHKDPLALFEIHLPELEASRAWLKDYAQDVLLDRFEQEAIYVVLVGPIQTLLVSRIEK